VIMDTDACTMNPMVMTLDTLVAQVHEVLTRENSPRSREEVAGLLAAALADPTFVATAFAEDVGERKVLYQDPDLGFCIVVHQFLGARSSVPHDHGPSWAIYGQAAGETLMSDFELLQPAALGKPGKVRKTRSYLMRQGDVHLYNEGDLHTPSRAATTRLIRIEGMDMSGVTRLQFETIEG
jgi:hypothetical protein